MPEQSPRFNAHDLFARHQTIAGLRALADFLEANPNVPVTAHSVSYYVHTRRDQPEACGRAAVDRVATLLGVPVRDDTDQGGHYLATRAFGPIRYEAVHVPQQARTLHDARWSYADNITLDDQDGQAA